MSLFGDFIFRPKTKHSTDENNASSSTCNSSKALVVSGIPILFPYKPYPSQLAMMNKIIQCLNRKHNCLLESPTGSGKSLALLCASLAWQKKIAREIEENNAKLDKHLNAYGAVIDDGENSSYNHTCETEQVKDPPTCKPETSNEFDSTKSPDPVCSNANAPKKRGVIFTDFDDDTDDFQPCKRYQCSPCSGNSKSSINHETSAKNAACHSPLANKTENFNVNPDVYGKPISVSDADSLKDSKFQCPTQKSCNGSDKVSCNKCPINSDQAKEEWSANGTKAKNDIDGSERLPAKTPVIYFGTRTHKQIEQIIRELRKTMYKDTQMTLLSSRDKSCIHPEASTSKNKNEACDELVKDKDGPKCGFYINYVRHSYYPSNLQQAFDLEDLRKTCKRSRICPYFTARDLLSAASVVFCPYNYLVDPLIRDAMNITLKGNILIMDEAHNIEDCAKEAASCCIHLSALEEARNDLLRVGQKSDTISECYLHNAKVLSNLIRWVQSNSENLPDYVSYDSSSKVWQGDEMVALLNYFGLGTDTFLKFQKYFEKILNEEKENDSEKKETENVVPDDKLMSSTNLCLKSFTGTLSYLYKCDLKFVPDYRFVIRKSKTFPSEGNRNALVNNSSLITVNFWCLNPAVALTDFKDSIHTLIVASGTLSPLTSFQSELGLPFQSTLEANHVVSKAQMWIGTIGRGHSSNSVTATYQSSNTFTFQDDVGNIVFDICSVIKHGILCFLPSYSMLDKLVNRWQVTGLWDKFSTKKVVLCEPKGQSRNFLQVIGEFYDAVKTYEDSSEGVDGALLFAVCRGKVSEGIDFPDNNARAVITIGIPFPAVKDAQVDLKRKYNDVHCSSRRLVNGSEWYQMQAFRALNQALGRCIRHRNDFGALILVDERFQKNQRYIDSLSKWIRKEIQHYPNLGDALCSLRDFSEKNGLKSAS